MRTQVEVLAWSQASPDGDPIREKVFVCEQGIPRDIVWDGADAEATHFLLWIEGLAVGTCRLRVVGQFGKLERMAVLDEYRGSGQGHKLVEACCDWSAQRGLTGVTLHSQMSAVDFYRHCGFVGRGEPFLEADIEHLTMERRVENATES